MSRTWILQSRQLAMAAAMMKCDANYVGVITEEAQARQLQEHHVWIAKQWREGELTPYRLRCLVHQLRAGDLLLLEDTLAEETLAEAFLQAKKANSIIILSMQSEMATDNQWAQQADIVLDIGEQTSIDVKNKRITVPSAMASASAAGALSLCLMNGLSMQRSEKLVTKAVALTIQYGHITWYDEVAYALT